MFLHASVETSNELVFPSDRVLVRNNQLLVAFQLILYLTHRIGLSAGELVIVREKEREGEGEEEGDGEGERGRWRERGVEREGEREREMERQREREGGREGEREGGRERENTSNKWLSGLNSVLMDREVSVDWVVRYTSCASFSSLSIPLAGPSPRVLK